MFKKLKQLKYGVRVLLSGRNGQAETIDINGRSTVMCSAGTGEPFLYLHSTLGESMRWLPFLQTWSKKFRVMAPLHPGFGDSQGFDKIDTIEDMAFHYIEMLDALGLEEVILGGVSLGGWIAAEVACRWPERVKKLWIADAPGLWVPDQPLPDLFRIMQDVKALRELIFYDPTGPIATMVLADNPGDEDMMTAYQCMTVLARLVWERPYDPKLPDRLHRIACPTLLVWGEHDKLVPPAYGKAYQAKIPHAEFKTIAKCGHMPMFEREAEFVEMVQAFCAQ